MNIKSITLFLVTLTCLSISAMAQAARDTSRYQAKAAATQSFGANAFEKSSATTLRWLGMAGWMVNSRGTTLMVDPVLEGFDMKVMIDYPILSRQVPRLDAILITHSDNDHFSIPTTTSLAKVTNAYYSTLYVDSLMKNLSFPSRGFDIGEKFNIGNIAIHLTPADHAYQNAYPRAGQRHFKNEDACGFWIETPDGSIWATGDSRLMKEHLTMKTPDAIIFDFSDSEWHFTLEGAVKLANAYPNTPLLLSHWGSVDAPGFSPFNGDPEKLKKLVINPERIQVLAPGQPYVLKSLKKE
ncbi:MBL fold metallo-hydrolase [Pedobacter sp. Leaf176]|uniref:MBL fold metallo-hydrolase n=1 Tax=Pedobacter sp. Leaf176 TaxID=1736286 RepID=UPI000A66D73E|nr:MBL fold metallo-hydrolase [Pedobacter sp. Leaf176]